MSEGVDLVQQLSNNLENLSQASCKVHLWKESQEGRLLLRRLPSELDPHQVLVLCNHNPTSCRNYGLMVGLIADMIIFTCL